MHSFVLTTMVVCAYFDFCCWVCCCCSSVYIHTFEIARKLYIDTECKIPKVDIVHFIVFDSDWSFLYECMTPAILKKSMFQNCPASQVTKTV